MITVRCHRCGFRNRFPDRYSGRKSSCDECGARLFVPEIDDEDESGRGMGSAAYWVWTIVAAVVAGVIILGAVVVANKRSAQAWERELQIPDVDGRRIFERR
jgi:predicted  nucleic acid-binding Zn-ribbon protein